MEPQPFDWSRIIWGDLSLRMVAEIAMRTAVMFVVALVVLRVMGRRGVRQLSPFDYVIIIALGSAVGDPMLYANVPLLHGAVILTVVVVLHRALARVTERSDAVDRFVTGSVMRIIEDGRVLEAVFDEAQLDREELFALLRADGITNLGQVRRAYMEKSGQLTVFRFEPGEERPGLPIEPPERYQRFDWQSGQITGDAGLYTCTNCGQVARFESGNRIPPCPVCADRDWVAAEAVTPAGSR